jgi:urea ABC transporter permease protein UrtC
MIRTSRDNAPVATMPDRSRLAWVRSRIGRQRSGLILVLSLLAVPLLFGGFAAYQIGLLLIYGLVAQGVALCWGRSGFLPLGQALFFGLGAYIAGWGLRTANGDWLSLLVPLALAVLAPAVAAGVVGLLVFARRSSSGPFFSLITLALSMLGFQLANSLDTVTGGFNGLTAIPGLPGIDSYSELYFVVIACLVANSLLFAWLCNSPFGLLLSAIRQNEERLQFLGFRTDLLKSLAFAISAAMAGLAGALFAAHQGIVTPQAVGFLLSSELVIWTAVGGRASLFGPVIGAVAIGYLSAELRDSFAYWEILVALIFIIVVLKFPEGFAARLDPSPAPHPLRTNPLPSRDRADSVALECRDVRLARGGVQILNGLDLIIAKPGIHCMIGPNGAGKTSAFNVLSGRFRLSSGDIIWNGRPIARRPVQVARCGIIRKFQIPSVFAELSVGESIDIALWANRLTWSQMFSSRPYRWTTPALDRLRTLFPFLDDTSKRAGALSAGERQMLEYAMVNLAEPRLLLLDEPCAGLSPHETAIMIAAIAAIHYAFGATVVIIEHDMQVVERLADFVHVLHLGARLAEGPVAEIKLNPAVQAVYAGGSK